MVSGSVNVKSKSSALVFNETMLEQCKLHGYELTNRKITQDRKLYRLVLHRKHDIELLAKFVVIKNAAQLNINFYVSIGWQKAAIIQQKLRACYDGIPISLKAQLQEQIDGLIVLPITSDASVFKTVSPAQFNLIDIGGIEDFVVNSVRTLYEVAAPNYKDYCDIAAIVNLVKNPIMGIYIADSTAAAILEAAV